MANKPEREILLVGHSRSIQELLAQAVRRCGASARSFATWKDCADTLRRGGCRLLVVDLDGDTGSALRTLRESSWMCPHVPTLVLVARGDIPGAVRAIKAGAVDCLEKPVDGKRLLSIVKSLLGQGARTGPDVGAVLTQTECLVLTRILEGNTNREIARALHRSPRTIEVHRRSIMRKLHASNLVELVKQAATTGFPF